ncbi:gamma-glutamylcysteine synthetase, putative [Pseudozyma hubeiensis SY62]|uniref:Gamma-glutamylcysteine synthetase, putative n=1 Tax=Pseudozyma hubeiensis (strain SY62) TaxID=1305764 RepID=R9P9M9_PSEHS|nr:gamma-glutamylcysteine synthetase, putative [Pseudozyma hubeiensis SY62]GAC97947.1 gamma-glutamylcysteine synthetase, putative [Pseudozyma hubeiensis SY62]
MVRQEILCRTSGNQVGENLTRFCKIRMEVLDDHLDDGLSDVRTSHKAYRVLVSVSSETASYVNILQRGVVDCHAVVVGVRTIEDVSISFTHKDIG